jgi:hypothetical protein
MEISISKRGAVFFDYPYGNGDSPFLYGDLTISVSKRELPYGNGKLFLLIPHMKIVITISIW